MAPGERPPPDRKSRPPGADWTAWLAETVLYASSTRPRGGPGTPHVASDQLRVSDSERAQVAEALSRHFGEGRLDHEELNERLQAAMSAKTRADLTPLLADLPPEVAEPSPPKGRPRLPRPGLSAPLAALLLVAIVLLASASVAGHVVSVIFLAAVVLLVLRRLGRHRAREARRWHAHLHQHGTPHWHGPHGPVLADPSPPPGVSPH